MHILKLSKNHLYLRRWFFYFNENEFGNNCEMVVSLTSPLRFVKYMSTPSLKNSDITCRQAPHGRIGSSLSPMMAILRNCLCPSDIALKIAILSAQQVNE